MAQAPATGVEPGIQAEVSLGTGEALILGAVQVAVVVQQCGGHAFIPVLRIDIAARVAVHGDLRHADIEALLAVVESGSGAPDQFRQGCAG
ncbi:hypothetical protein D9M71_787870 [compost metagenome]